MPNQVLLGPVLSFRGLEKSKWKVSALIGIDSNQPFHTLEIEGKDCPPPIVLHEHNGKRIARYDLSVQLDITERKVSYGLKGGAAQWSFTVPGKDMPPRMAYASCNGYSNYKEMKGYSHEEMDVWLDLLSNHDKTLRDPAKPYAVDTEQFWHEEKIHDRNLQRFHVLLMGGDQIYFDSIWEDKRIPELQKWALLNRGEQAKYKVSKALDKKVEDYYFNLYFERWVTKSPAIRSAADAMATTPTVMMWDDHDIIDGWGSHTIEAQQSPLLKAIFRHARRAFWVYQMQHQLDFLPELVEDTSRNLKPGNPLYEPIKWSQILQGDALGLPMLDDQPGFSSAFNLNQISILNADMRTERSRTQVLSKKSWIAINTWLDTKVDGTDNGLSSECQYLLFMSAVPAIYPDFELLESFVADSVTDGLTDDIRDHWSHPDHEPEHKRLFEVLASVSSSRQVKVAILSGDVHVGGIGRAYRKDVTGSSPIELTQLISSAIVHPPVTGIAGFLLRTYLASRASQQKEFDNGQVTEMMVFPNHGKHIMSARNWMALELSRSDTKAVPGSQLYNLWVTWRCEKGQNTFSNHLSVIKAS
jgi:hypothetical protein